MILCRICDLNIRIETIHKNIETLFCDYLADFSKPDITLRVTEDELQAEKEKYPEHSKSYLEGQLLFKQLAEKILAYDTFFFHSAAVCHENEGYLFTGKSGSGKSTHAALWTKLFPDDFIINGDKPLIKMKKDGFYVYGTPWCGKENMQKNTSAKLRAVFFIEQTEENRAEKMSAKEVLAEIFNQTVYVKNPTLNEALFKMLDRFITELPFFRLKCRIDDGAVLCALAAAKGEKK